MTDSPCHDVTPVNEKSEGMAPSPAPRRALKREYSGKKETMNGPLYMQASNNVMLVRRIKRKGEGPMKQFERWFVENQIGAVVLTATCAGTTTCGGLSFNLLALLFLVHWFMPKARVHTSKFYTLSYYNPKSGNYAAGWDDAYLIFFCVVLCTGLRASAMEYILAPIAKWQGISKRRVVTRFSEQAWMLVYYIVFWTLGMYIYCNSPYFLNLRNLWSDWPNRELDGLLKGYMLFQLAFWLQQILVINIEERRKDHWQMLTHHVITITLIYSCYRYHFTRVGNLILVLMDVSDLFLPIAKCLKYVGYNTLCDLAFVGFMLSWFVCRHIFYIIVCYSVWVHTWADLPHGCFRGSNDNLTGPFEPPHDIGLRYLVEPFLDSEGIVCYDHVIQWSFLTTLLFLQALTIAWFAMIIRVAMRVLQGAGADDARSDEEEDGLEDEEEEEEELVEGRHGDEEFVYEEARPLEEEVGVDEIDLKGWERRAGVRRQAAAATGVSLPGHSDRKELLGRIGCEKQVE